MNIVSALIVFVMIWWTVLFCVLPWGQATTFDAATNSLDENTTKAPNMKQKALITTLISLIIWIITVTIIQSDIIDFQKMVSHS